MLLLLPLPLFIPRRSFSQTPTKFNHYGSIPETMYTGVTAKSKVMADYRLLPPKEPRVLTPEQQAALEVVDKPSNRGKRVAAKMEPTEEEKPKPSKSTKRKLESESSSKPMKIKKLVKRSKQQYPPRPDHFEQDEEDNVPPASPRVNTPPRSPPQTKSPPHKFQPHLHHRNIHHQS